MTDRSSKERLGADFYRRHPLDVAPELLGAVLVHRHPDGVRRGRVVEVEAYCGADDPAAHTYRGRTDRNSSMFEAGGALYVYRSYGIHWCANVVCGAAGDGVAVLLRALAPIDGLEAMFTDRGPAARRTRDLCSGPGKLTQAMGISGSDDGIDLVVSDRVHLEAGDRSEDVVQATRIGISVAVDEPWRWYLAGDHNVSKR